MEVCRHFHPEVFKREWLERGRALSAALATDGADVLDRVLDHIESGAPPHTDAALVASLLPDLRRVEQEVDAGARELARTVHRALGRGRPLTDLGDRVATSLQTSRDVNGNLLSVGV
jgi:hypothetical protein